MELQHIHDDRAAAATYLAEAMQGLYAGEPTSAPLVGGRTAGMQHLRVFNVGDYRERRNDVGPDAGASLLSPYIRHGCLSLTEIKQEALDKIGSASASKFIQELAWRQFWQLQWECYGDRIFDDLEDPKVPLGTGEALPEDIAGARTGLRCMDISLRSLYESGYIYNHARMWLAAYLVHHRKLKWQVGAELFYRFLLDGDPASNSLSWQWVASTFSHKPYFFNRDNVQKYSRDSRSGDTYCSGCPAAEDQTCPFDFSYEDLGKQLFGADYEGDNGYRNQAGKDRGLATRRSSSRR